MDRKIGPWAGKLNEILPILFKKYIGWWFKTLIKKISIKAMCGRKIKTNWETHKNMNWFWCQKFVEIEVDKYIYYIIIYILGVRHYFQKQNCILIVILRHAYNIHGYNNTSFNSNRYTELKNIKIEG